MIPRDWDKVRQGQYEALTQRVAWLDVGPRTELEITGRDRIRVVNNFCTADIRRLEVGQGSEAFILSVKGTTLGHGGFYVASERIELSTVADQASLLVAHMRQYVVSEVVEFADASSRTSSLLLVGPDAATALKRLHIDHTPCDRLNHWRTAVDSIEITIRRTDLLGADGFEFVVLSTSKLAFANLLTAVVAEQCQPDVLETVRIENRIPKYSVDIDAKNLPQEVGRNSWAISFNKGCYLGQETVARLDSLGHVNRHWVALAIDSTQVPETGPLMDANGKPVARVTSATWSPRLGKPLALAYVRDGQHLPGTVLAAQIGHATVLE